MYKRQSREMPAMAPRKAVSVPVICPAVSSRSDWLNRRKSVSYTHLTLPTSDLV